MKYDAREAETAQERSGEAKGARGSLFVQKNAWNMNNRALKNRFGTGTPFLCMSGYKDLFINNLSI